jgi:hypothetical protein
MIWQSNNLPKIMTAKDCVGEESEKKHQRENGFNWGWWMSSQIFTERKKWQRARKGERGYG